MTDEAAANTMNNSEIEAKGEVRRPRPELPAVDAEPTDDGDDNSRPAKRRCDSGPDVTRSTTGLLDLPLSSLVEITHHLSILESRKFVMTCSRLWTNRHRLEGDRHTAVVQSAAERQVLQGLLLRRPFASLETLDLGEWATNEFITALDWRQNVPQLRELSLEGSSVVSGTAVVRALRLHPSLRYVNVTYCPLVGYLDALRLRDCLGQPNAIVRRLPQEMCGLSQRPEGGDDDAALNEHRKCVGRCRD
jgi:hypothetical protein